MFMLLLMKVYMPIECNVMMEEIDEVSLDGLAETSGSWWQGKEVSRKTRPKPSLILYPYHIDHSYFVDTIEMRACLYHSFVQWIS